MTRIAAWMLGVAVALAAMPAAAQIINPGLPPPIAMPPPPPPPRIEVPVVPKFDDPAAAPLPKAVPPPRRSFGRRITDCLHQGAGAGLNSSEREAYSRACANQ